MPEFNRIGILCNGGDAPGLNVVIKWGTKTLLEDKVASGVLGILEGYSGLIEVQTIPLDPVIVRKWDRDSGTNLGISRTNPFSINGQDRSKELIENMDSLSLEALIVLGGEGSLRAAVELRKKGVPLVGIPKTIDNDVLGTDYTLGFDSAVNENKRVITNYRNSAGSHRAIQVVQLMGRNSGLLTLHSGIASNVVLMLIPEYPFTLDKVVGRLRERRAQGVKYDIVLVSEKARIEGEPEHEEIGKYLAERIAELTGYKVRYDVVGMIQRGAPVTAFDAEVGRAFGIAAVELIRDRRFGQMVALKDGSVTSIPLDVVTEGIKKVNVPRDYNPNKLTAKKLGIGARLYA